MRWRGLFCNRTVQGLFFPYGLLRGRRAEDVRLTFQWRRRWVGYGVYPRPIQKHILNRRSRSVTVELFLTHAFLPFFLDYDLGSSDAILLTHLFTDLGFPLSVEAARFVLGSRYAFLRWAIGSSGCGARHDGKILARCCMLNKNEKFNSKTI